MPKLARYLLAWSKEDGRYELRERGENTSYALREDDEWWPSWLAEHRSFAFQGKQGHLNLLKEARARGSDYWYAYRSQNRRTSKRYAGRTADITFSRLEELAGAFMREVEPQAPVPAEDPLLEPKLHAPRLQAALVARERLFARMQSGLERKLTLLCAPAGFGKTTLAGQWLNECRTHAQMPPVAWIALDSGDNDPIRFWRYVITACQRFHTGLGRALLAQLSDGLSISFELPSLETVLTPLLNEMARVGCSGMLILEDYHLITEARIQETLIFFLDHLPENMHVVMLTRSEPPFPLARWRARGELCEVLAADLRFSQEESASFFQQMQMSPAVTFSEEALRRLNERVEGWAAGLRLLALALQGSMRGQELEGALANFTGDQRSLQEYFVMEVLNAQSETLQDFLLRTSVISRLTGSLCDAVIERHGSARLLESVERAGLFLESLDGSGEWYRYHALFAEAMRVEARRRLGNDAMRLLYLRASQWYAQQEMLPEAIEAAFQAQDIERAAALIERLLEERANFIFGARIFQKMPEFHTLRRWLERLPEAILGAHPLLCLYYAASLMFICFLEQRVPSATITVQLGKMLQMAEESWRREGNRSRLGELLAFRAMILRQPGVMREAAGYARQALELLPVEAVDGRMMSLWLLGMGEVEEGHFTLARKAFLEVRAFYEAVGSDGIMRANTVWLSWLDYVQGALPQAAESFRRLLDEARAVEDIDDICDALLGLAQLAYEENELSTAEQQAQEALELARQLNNHDLR
ncbi:MAG: hypothetical protein J2P36_00230, partial [Ktedonobacteraceae bacterium]|nr:hypothetical protein [Ktedonobacteraceae bacterium]